MIRHGDSMNLREDTIIHLEQETRLALKALARKNQTYNDFLKELLEFLKMNPEIKRKLFFGSDASQANPEMTTKQLCDNEVFLDFGGKT
jgi:hypothetical protein